MGVADELLFDIAEGVATFTLNRPDKRNAFTDEMVHRWVALLTECSADDAVQAILFTANGNSFCAGADTGQLAGNAQKTPLEARDRMSAVAHKLVRTVSRLQKPVIAAVNGAAVGGGMDISLMCDVRIASASARFAETYAKVGLLPGVGGAWFLPRIVGTATALDLFWTGRWVDAEEALSLGIVNRVYADDEFAEAARSYATQVAAAAPLSVRSIKKLVYQGLQTGLDVHLDALAAELAIVRTSDDHKEALAAMKEKRAPRFKGS